MDIIFIIATYADIRSIGNELNQKGTIYDLTIFGGGGLAGRGARLVRYSVCVCVFVCLCVCVCVCVLVIVLVLVLMIYCVDMLLVLVINKTYSLKLSIMQLSLLSSLLILLIVLV